MVAIDPADLYKRGTFPSLSPLQQQPQLSYQTNPGVFQPPDLPDNSHFKPIMFGTTDQNPSGLTLPYQQPIRAQNVPYQQPMTYPTTTQNLFPNPAPQSYTLKTRNLNPIHQGQDVPGVAFSTTFRNSLAPSMIQKTGFLPQATYTNASLGMNPIRNQAKPNSNFSRPPMQYNSKPHPFPTSSNPFSYGATYNQMAIAQTKPNFHSGNRYSQSTGGKERRQYIPARRKGVQGTVSAGSAFKFTFGDKKLRPSTSTSFEKKIDASNQESFPDGQILMFSSTREGKPNTRFKKTPSPETVFVVEPEDRYWDALSTKAQTTR